MGLLKHVPVRLRITMGLVGLMAGTLLMASALGFFPNVQKEILNRRGKLCETLAISGTGMASAGQMATLKSSLEAIVKRDDDVLSIGLRLANGELLVVAGPHSEHWRPEIQAGVEQNQVPVFKSGEEWAHLEVCFASTGGVLGLNYWAPAWLLIVMVPALLIQYSIFLRKTLKHLDPSAGVPQHVQDALNTLSVGLVLMDGDQRVLFANREFASSLELECDDVEGVELSKMDWEIPGADENKLPWQRLGDATETIGDQLLQMTINSRKKTFSINCTTVGNGMLATFDDITLLQEAREAAQQASESKSSFLANMSHEIRTPLNAVLGFTDVLRRGLVVDADESIDHLNMIHRSGKHLLRLINDILDLSKIEAGKMDVESIDTALGEIIVDTADVLGVRAREKEIALNVKFDSPLPKTIQSDPTRLRQIITNLIGNAIKFTEQGSVTIGAQLVHGDRPCIRIDIIDTGVGMTPDQQAKIFDSFSQADETTTRKFGGTGLGLSISRQLTEALGGQLTVSSELGTGSTFTVTLPIRQEDTETLISPDSILSASGSEDAKSVGTTICLPPKSILVVDDGEANRRLIELVITRAGGKVSVAENGLQAIEVIADQSFDLIFMDMQMPIVDGYTATRRLREAGVTTPIIALTGNAMKGDRERCMQAGCDDFLTKPVEIDLLLERTAHYIGHASAEPLERERGATANNDRLPSDLAPSDDATSDDATSDDATSDDVPIDVPTSGLGTPRLTGQLSSGSDVAAPHVSAPHVSTPHVSTPVVGPQDGRRVPAEIHSTLPMDDDAFREIVIDFVGRLEARLDGIDTALATADFDRVRQEAHWLKGAGGTVGFPAFTEPARALEQASREQDRDLAEQILDSIHQIHASIVVPGMTTRNDIPCQLGDPNSVQDPVTVQAADPIDAAAKTESASDRVSTQAWDTVASGGDPIPCSLPFDDAEMIAIVSDYLDRLDERLVQMQTLCDQGRFDQLASQAHWLKGSGGTVGYHAISNPAAALEQAAKRADRDEAYEALQAVIAIRRRLLLPGSVETV